VCTHTYSPSRAVFLSRTRPVRANATHTHTQTQTYTHHSLSLFVSRTHTALQANSPPPSRNTPSLPLSCNHFLSATHFYPCTHSARAFADLFHRSSEGTSAVRARAHTRTHTHEQTHAYARTHTHTRAILQVQRWHEHCATTFSMWNTIRKRQLSSALLPHRCLG